MAKVKENRSITIYVVTNIVNGKQYVGQTVMTLRKRLLCHFSQAKRTGRHCVLHNAIRKYGRDQFEIEPLEVVCGCETADEVEKRWIKKLSTKVPNGYNVEDGGNVNRGSLSSKTKAKMKKARIGWKNTDWYKKVCEALKNKSPEWKANISEGKKGKKATETQLNGLKLGWSHKRPLGFVAGEANPRALLTAEQVKEIRRLYWSNPGIIPGKRGQRFGANPVPLSQDKLAIMFEVKQVTISKILTGDTWPEAIPDEYVGKFEWEPRVSKKVPKFQTVKL